MANYDNIEIEFYGNTMEEIKAQKKDHMKMMKEEGLLFDYNNQ